jgi:hypothetical protein
MKHKISNSILVILIIGIPLALFLIYRDMPKVVAAVDPPAEVIETVNPPERENPLIHWNNLDWGVIEKPYAHLKIRVVYLKDSKNSTGESFEGPSNETRLMMLDHTKFGFGKVLVWNDLDWVDDPDYPTIYMLEVCVLDDFIKWDITLNIFTTAKPRMEMKRGDKSPMLGCFYPFFDTTNDYDYTLIEMICSPRQQSK